MQPRLFIDRIDQAHIVHCIGWIGVELDFAADCPDKGPQLQSIRIGSVYTPGVRTIASLHAQPVEPVRLEGTDHAQCAGVALNAQAGAKQLRGAHVANQMSSASISKGEVGAHLLVYLGCEETRPGTLDAGLRS